MKQNLHPGVVAAIVVAMLCVVIGIWVWQPWTPKAVDVPTPTREERLKFSESMKASMLESMKHRH